MAEVIHCNADDEPEAFTPQPGMTNCFIPKFGDGPLKVTYHESSWKHCVDEQGNIETVYDPKPKDEPEEPLDFGLDAEIQKMIMGSSVGERSLGLAEYHKMYEDYILGCIEAFMIPAEMLADPSLLVPEPQYGQGLRGAIYRAWKAQQEMKRD